MGKDGEEEMMEDTVEANKLFTNLSCLNGNIHKKKTRGLFCYNDDDNGPTDCKEVIEGNLQSDTMNRRIESSLCHRKGENILGEGGGVTRKSSRSKTRTLHPKQE